MKNMAGVLGKYLQEYSKGICRLVSGRLMLDSRRSHGP